MVLVGILAIFYFKWIYNKFGNSIPFLIIFLIYLFWALFSIIYLDGGTFISEQNRDSYYTGASIRFLFVTLPFFVAAPIFFSKKYQKEDDKRTPIKLKPKFQLHISVLIQLISFLVLGYLYANLIVSGIPLFVKEITNFNFYEKFSSLPMASTIQSTFLLYFILANGAILASKDASKIQKGFAIFYYLLAIVYRLLFGEKFYPFLIYTVFFFLPLLTKIFSQQKNKGFLPKKIIISGTILAVLLISSVYVKYSLNPSKQFDSPMDHLMSRMFALQSHTFWGYDLYLQNEGSGFNFDLIKKELHAGVTKRSKFDADIGLTRIMYIVSPKSIVNRYIKNMTRFYGGYWTLAIGCFGYVFAAFYSLLIAFIFAWYAVKFAIAIRDEDFVFLFFCSSAYYIFFTYFNEANYSFLFSNRMILFTVIIIIYPKISKWIYAFLRKMDTNFSRLFQIGKCKNEGED